VTVPSSVPFDVPTDVAPFPKVAIKRAHLIDLFEINRSDFIDCAGLLYSDIVRLDPSVLGGSGVDGFNAFCDVFAQYLLAAPTQVNHPSTDLTGRFANFFGAAIAEHIDSQIKLQDWYGADGEKKHGIGENLALDFITFVAIQAFGAGISDWDPAAIKAAEQRLSQLQTGKRCLKAVGGQGPYGKPISKK
jgi:hypothetical protein